MLKELLNNILKAGGLFCGGFVRDYLIRGEDYNDIDFYFPLDIPEPYASWKFIGGAKTMIIAGKKFHCATSPYDLTCNVFSFDGEKIVARPTYIEFSYAKSWEMIFKKQFVYTNRPDTGAREKMKRRGWEMVSIDFRKRPEPFAPSCGVWSDFKQAKERFESLT